MQFSGASVRRIARDFAISTAFWLSMSVLMAWQEYMLARQANLNYSISEMMLLFAVRCLTLALITPLIFYIVEWRPLKPGALLGRGAGYLLGFALFTIAFASIRWCIYPPWLPETQHWGARSLHSFVDMLYEMFADEFVTYIGIVIAAHAYVYFFSVQRQEREQLELKQALTQSELQALKSQIHPHFLFNTLHGISTLVESDPTRAQRMIVNLSRLLRRAIQHDGVDLVTLGEDLQFAEEYLNIEKMRLGDRLTVRWSILPESRKVLVPQLILQPLIENAVKHGVSPAREGGWIDVSSAMSGQTLNIEVKNSALGVQKIGTGLGLQNIRMRLKCLYGDDASLHFLRDDRIATASLTLPAFSGAEIAEPEVLETR
jgi:two-component system, LytTR family, sensor kinase